LSQHVASQGRSDKWESGAAYEPYVGRWSRLVAREFLRWLDEPPGSRWIDVGCGTGALTRTLLEVGSPAAVTALDRSRAYLLQVGGSLEQRAALVVGDAQRLPIPGSSADAVVSGLVLNFVPDAQTALREMARVARPGGSVALYVWDYAGDMQMMRYFWDAAASLDPAAASLDEGVRFPVCRPQPLISLFEGAGLDPVTVTPIDILTIFQDFDDYWTPFLGGQGPAPGYCTSLDEDRRARLRENLRAALPFEPDGTIRLVARAWAVRGVRR
jgi:SAM-dependent methyltransferase